jgi:hypothetical protein
MARIGKKAPAFKGQAVLPSGEIAEISLDDYLNKGVSPRGHSRVRTQDGEVTILALPTSNSLPDARFRPYISPNQSAEVHRPVLLPAGEQGAVYGGGGVTCTLHPHHEKPLELTLCSHPELTHL